MKLILLALAPVLVVLAYIYLRDKYEREPAGRLFLMFLAGGLSVIPVWIVGSLIEGYSLFLTGYSRVAYTAFILAAAVEEGFKFLFLFLLAWKSRSFNEKFDGIVYAVFVSLGFAAVENILYVIDGGSQVGFIRALTAVPGHALFGIAMGYHLGIARMYAEIRRRHLLYALLVPVILHGIYDFILMSGHPYLLLLFGLYLAYLWYGGFRQMKVLSDSSLFRKPPQEG